MLIKIYNTTKFFSFLDSKIHGYIFILDEDGMTWGVVLANINVPLSISDKTAAMFKEVRLPRNNRWVFYDSEKVLKIGDIINYKIAVEHRGKKYYSGPHSFRVNGT
jgi:Carbohydrate binding domain (family 32)